MKTFTAGYICAVANLLRERDTPVAVQGLLESLGVITVASLKAAGVDNDDIKVLKKYKLI